MSCVDVTLPPVTANRPLLLVAAAALIDKEGRILLAERPAGKYRPNGLRTRQAPGLLEENREGVVSGGRWLRWTAEAPRDCGSAVAGRPARGPMRRLPAKPMTISNATTAPTPKTPASSSMTANAKATLPSPRPPMPLSPC